MKAEEFMNHYIAENAIGNFGNLTKEQMLDALEKYADLCMDIQEKIISPKNAFSLPGEKDKAHPQLKEALEDCLQMLEAFATPLNADAHELERKDKIQQIVNQYKKFL